MRVPTEVRVALQQALSPPAASGNAAADLLRLSAYVSEAWSPTRAVGSLLAIATAAGASDIHLESSVEGTTVRLRLDGELCARGTLPPAGGERLLAAARLLGGCLPYRRDIPQEGRIFREGVAADVRVAFLPTALGERGVFRLFGRLLGLADLGFDANSEQALRVMLARPSGLMLVAGPSGAGKTTTLYACLGHLAASRGGAHLSIEHPVEQRLRLAGIPVDQVELCPERGFTAEAALVAALRQDVDVLAVGEVRTAGDAALAVQAAHTGRLVLAGLHAGGAAEALQRLLDLGVAASVLRDTPVAVLHQRLISGPCGDCSGSGCAACGGSGRRRRPVVTTWVGS
ncbi:hypothetical protein LBMAG42_09010 [Deltaproteobacteria bacterium]|nr:hypothetical protein LBMAG42_09010 [Deltaproteobacteria bacterium]